ncbi:MAG TPA: CDP-alcohol phosphatidyltransferase family protein [Thermomicrobiales bacterium]|nr:CDP-alcohol phosphatidyltransferase family protein [Thermomicrobiales bacterium]
MISELLGAQVRGMMLRVGAALARRGFSANLLTVLGLALNVLVAVVIASGHLVAGGVLLLVASAFDMLDGAVARAAGSASSFGGFLDSTLDRYSEVVVYLGLLVYFLDRPDARAGAILTFLATIGALLISYARARAEAAGFTAAVGLVARPERVLILAICLLIGRPTIAVWILAITTHLTALTRIVHVWKSSKAAPAGPTAPKARPAAASSGPDGG